MGIWKITANIDGLPFSFLARASSFHSALKMLIESENAQQLKLWDTGRALTVEFVGWLSFDEPNQPIIDVTVPVSSFKTY